jgi:hypothetical protein
MFGLNFKNPNRKIKWLPGLVYGYIGKITYYDEDGNVRSTK